MLTYSNSQREIIRSNLRYLATDALGILRFIQLKKEVAHNDIPKELDYSKYVVDKCIAAFLVSGLIDRREEGSSKIYSITEEGQKLLDEKGEN